MNEPMYKRIFILGSGFSKSFSSDMPTIKDLTSNLFNLKPPENNYNWYKNLFNYVKTFNKICESDKDDTYKIKRIENITTTIFSRMIFADKKEEEYYNKLKREILQYIYYSLNDSTIDQDKEESAKKFLHSCLKTHLKSSSYSNSYKGKDLIITFNYDLLLENLFIRKMHKRINYGVPLGQYPEILYRGDNGMPEYLLMLKLHGSFNWFKAKGATDINMNSVYHVEPWDEDNFVIHENDIPIFIPMAHGKELFLKGTLYNTLWVRAFNYLSKAKEIYFIGYGFPETDINNLLNFWQFKKKIKKIVVYYKDKDKNKDLKRLKNLFGEDKIINKDAKQFIDENPHKFNY